MGWLAKGFGSCGAEAKLSATRPLRAINQERVVDGQTSLLVGHRSGAERRWIEAARSTEPGSLVRRRYSACPVDSCRNVYSVSQSTMRLMRRSRTLRKGVGACVASVFLAEFAIFPGHGVSASRAGHAGFVSTDQRTDIFVREYCRCRAGGSERGTQHRAVALVERAGFPGHCCTVSFLEPRPSGVTCALVIVIVATEALPGLTNTATRATLGTSSCRSRSRLATTSLAKKLMPVALPPGWARLATRPS